MHHSESIMPSDDKPTELDEKTLRGKEFLTEAGFIAGQANHQAKIEGVSKSPINPSQAHMPRVISIVLGLALVAAIIYSGVITRDRDTLNTQLASEKSRHASTKETLASTQVDLNSTQASLASTQSALASTKQVLISTQSELTSTGHSLVSAHNKLEDVEAKLSLYKETMGIDVITSNVQPSYQKGGLGRPTVSLYNVPTATNPTWSELMAFLRTDPTDDETYTGKTGSIVLTSLRCFTTMLKLLE
ncbi:hypothetical protein ACFLV4_02935 [Chloroflexota bacterium]